MKLLILTLCFSGAIVLSIAYNIDRTDSSSTGSGWRKPFAELLYQVPPTQRDSADAASDTSNWRNQRNFGFKLSDYIKPSSFGDFWNWNNFNKKDDETVVGPKIKLFPEGEDEYTEGAIGCPPEVVKCIPRLG